MIELDKFSFISLVVSFCLVASIVFIFIDLNSQVETITQLGCRLGCIKMAKLELETQEIATYKQLWQVNENKTTCEEFCKTRDD